MNDFNRELEDIFLQLDPDDQAHIIKLIMFCGRDPGFTDAVRALPRAPGADMPSRAEIEALMAVRGKQVYL